MNRKMIYMSLLGSSSSLGLNWIYDKELMVEFSKNNNVLFLPIQHDLYSKAEHGFDVYPNHNIGDLDFMGEVLYIYHEYLLSDKKIELNDYFFQKFGPDSKYDGYLEKYGKVLIENVKSNITETNLVDTQLIGPAMYIIGYAHNVKDEDILKHTKVLTAYEGTKSFHKSLRYIFNNISHLNKTDVLKESITFLDQKYIDNLVASFSDLEVYEFISKHSGVACDLEQSYPLVYYIINHSNSLSDALTLNASLGGASSARGLIIGAVFSMLEGIPEQFENVLSYQI